MDDDETEARRLDCWRRFEAAAFAGVEGDFGPAAELVGAVAARYGQDTAHQARVELWRYIKGQRLKRQRARGGTGQATLFDPDPAA